MTDIDSSELLDIVDELKYQCAEFDQTVYSIETCGLSGDQLAETNDELVAMSQTITKLCDAIKSNTTELAKQAVKNSCN